MLFDSFGFQILALKSAGAAFHPRKEKRQGDTL